MLTRSARVVSSLIAALAIVLATVSVAVAAEGVERSELLRPTGQALTIVHGPVEVALADPSSDGHQLGDLRVVSVPVATEDGSLQGRLDATLTTTAIDAPGPGDEIRAGELIFSFGDNGEHQVIVAGSAIYPAAGGTIATGNTTVRPIVGGSGDLAGASGEAVTEHLDDGSWRHSLFIQAATDIKPQKAGEKGKAARPDKIKIDIKAPKEKKDKGEPREVVRTDLGLAQPASAPGEELGLRYYVIPGYSDLAPHDHPGWQIARILHGELAYTVYSGEGTLIRADGNSQSIGPGTYILREGDTVIENPDLEHSASNQRKGEVRIVAATLFGEGEPLSSPVEVPMTSEPTSDTEGTAVDG